MFSKRLYKVVSLITRLSCYFGATSLQFVETELTFQVDPIARRRMKRNYALFIFWALASLGMAYKFYKNGDLDRLNVTLAYWITGMLASMYYTLCRWFSHDLCILLNGTFLFIRYLHKTYMPNFNPDESKSNLTKDFVLYFYCVVFLSSFTFVTAILIYDPRGLIFLGELIPPQYFYFPIRVFIIAFHVYLLIVIHVNVTALNIYISIYGLHIAPFLISELRLGRPQPRYRSLVTLRQPHKLRHIYRSFQILQANFLCFLGLFIFLCHSGFMINSIYCNFVLMRYWNALLPLSTGQLLIWAVSNNSFWTFVLQLGRYFVCKGSKVLASWKENRWENRYNCVLMKKFHRSCKPILLCYGRQFVVRRVTMLNFQWGVVRGTFRTMILSRQWK